MSNKFFEGIERLPKETDRLFIMRTLDKLVDMGITDMTEINGWIIRKYGFSRSAISMAKKNLRTECVRKAKILENVTPNGMKKNPPHKQS